MKKILIVLLLFFSGCVTGMEGVTTTQIDNNIYQVSFAGSGWTDKEQGVDYMLIKASDLALQNGYIYFIVKDTQDTSKIKINQYGNVETRPRLACIIECYKDKPQTNMTVYNAEITSKNLKLKHNIQ